MAFAAIPRSSAIDTKEKMLDSIQYLQSSLTRMQARLNALRPGVDDEFVREHCLPIAQPMKKLIDDVKDLMSGLNIKQDVFNAGGDAGRYQGLYEGAVPRSSHALPFFADTDSRDSSSTDCKISTDNESFEEELTVEYRHELKTSNSDDSKTAKESGVGISDEDRKLASGMLRGNDSLEGWDMAKPGDLQTVQWHRGCRKTRVLAEITKSESPYRFFVRREEDVQKYEDLHDEIQNIVPVLLAQKVKFNWTQSVRLLPVLAKYVDDQWYRGFLWQDTGHSLDSSSHVHVYFVDYGDLQVMSVDKLLPLPSNLAQLPAAALQCRVKDASQTCIDHVACKKFKEKYYDERQIFMEMHKPSRNKDSFYNMTVYYVEIYHKETPNQKECHEFTKHGFKFADKMRTPQ